MSCGEAFQAYRWHPLVVHLVATRRAVRRQISPASPHPPKFPAKFVRVHVVAGDFPVAEENDWDIVAIQVAQAAIGIDVDNVEMGSLLGQQRLNLAEGFLTQVAAGPSEQGEVERAGDLDAPQRGALVLAGDFVQAAAGKQAR